MEAFVAEQLTTQTLDLEGRGTSLTHHVVSLDKELYSTLSLFTQVYNWVPATNCWGGGGVTLQWTSIPSRGVVAILLSMLYAKETGISSGRLGLWLVCAFFTSTVAFDFYVSTYVRKMYAGI